MRKRTLIVAALLGCAMLMGQASQCLGAWCLNSRCQVPLQCGINCSCMIRGNDITGDCVSFRAVPGLLEQGYRVLP
jgi:hypothetical protein